MLNVMMIIDLIYLMNMMMTTRMKYEYEQGPCKNNDQCRDQGTVKGYQETSSVDLVGVDCYPDEDLVRL